MTDRFGDAQFHDPPGQQPQRPVGVSRGRRGKTHRDQLRFLPAVQQFRSRRVLASYPIKCLFKPTFNQMLTNILHRFGATSIGLGDLPIRPRRTIGIGLEQNLSPPNLLARPAQLPDHLAKLLAFLIGQTNHIFLSHQSLLALKRLVNDYPNSLL